MATLGEVLSLATPRGVTMEKFWVLWVSRSLENEFTINVDLNMVSDTDAYTKFQPHSPYTFI